jgi:hypothetical protein
MPSHVKTVAKKLLWVLFALLAIAIGLYPSVYFIIDRNFGLLGSKPDELLANILWNISFYIHIIFGGIALLIGWTQFSTKLRTKNVSMHRNTGKVYVTAAILSSLSGIGIGFFATGGIIPSVGFIGLGLTWFFTTLMAYIHIKNKRIDQHRNMMIYSYAACFAAITLRIWLPLLTNIFGDFITAYKIVAWLCWIPNIIIAYIIVRLRKKMSVRQVIVLKS